MRARQSGVAIVIAMGVVALAALASTALLVSQSTWARQVELSGDHVQARLLIRAGLDWGRAVLSDDARNGNLDTLGEPWAMRLPPIPVENGSLLGHIEDEQGKFNLNNLLKDGKISLTHLAQLQRLLALLSLPVELADSIADWIDADSEPQPGAGAEDAYYLSLPTPYLAANRPLQDLAELALVRGFDGKTLGRLRPFITALPTFTPVNVNTASAEVLAAISEGMKLDQARAIVSGRERKVITGFEDFLQRLPKELAVPSREVSVGSDYFLATMRVNVGGSQARGTALLVRQGAGWPIVLWRKYP